MLPEQKESGPGQRSSSRRDFRPSWAARPPSHCRTWPLGPLQQVFCTCGQDRSPLTAAWSPVVAPPLADRRCGGRRPGLLAPAARRQCLGPEEGRSYLPSPPQQHLPSPLMMRSSGQTRAAHGFELGCSHSRKSGARDCGGMIGAENAESHLAGWAVASTTELVSHKSLEVWSPRTWEFGDWHKRWLSLTELV